MVLVDFTFDLVSNMLATSGYLGLFFLMTLDSMPTPVPSELVGPFAGYLVFTGEFSFVLALIAVIGGSMVGSLLTYYIGLKGGRPVVQRYGKYMLIKDHHIDKAEAFFKKHGSKAILISRFVPGVRALISLPAGIAKMDIRKFSLYTLIGAGIWDFILVYSGLVLGERWNIINVYAEPLDKLVLGAIVLLVVAYIVKRQMKKRKP